MVEDTGDDHPIAGHAIKDAVALVPDAADAEAIVGPGFANERKVLKSVQEIGDRSLVGIGHLATESLATVSIDVDQIEARVLA